MRKKLKKGIAMALALAMALGLTACTSEPKQSEQPTGNAGIYTAGTYSAEAQGMESAVKVSVTVSESEITDVTIDVSGETAGYGADIGDAMKEAVMEAQSAEVDGVSGATITSDAVKSAVQKCLDQAMGKEPAEVGGYTAGTYTAEAKGRNGAIVVSVTFSEDSIESVEVTEQAETYGLAWGLTTSPVEVLPEEIVRCQSLGVDSISGATLTSAAIKQAVADCVTQAGGDAEALKSAPVDRPEPTDETYDADVVVVGAGAAGLSAAIAANDQGAKVIVLEKQGVTGGATARSGGKIVAAGTKWQEAHGITDTPKMMFDYFKEIGGDLIDDDLLKLYCDRSAENMEWLESKGVVFQDVEAIHSALSPWRVHNPQGGGGQKTGGSGNGAQITVPLTKDLEESGVEILYNVCADELLCSDAGVVEGISGVRPDGSRVTVNAKSVVLCTGGYAQNKEMMERYAETTEGFMTLVPTSNTGDGLVMAEAVGAQIFDSPATQVIYVSKTCGVGIKEEAGLIVNARGERVVNEYTYQYHVGQGIANSGCSYGYYIASAADPNPTVQYGLTLESTPHAATAAELAEHIGVDPAVLEATISRYNELCALGVDEDFGKPQDKMVPIEGEIYALRLDPSVTVTYGGLVTDTSARVLDENNQPISGLYAAGEVAFTGLCGEGYPSCGLAVGTAAFFGRVAGESAAAAE
ncbi:MAG: FAD-dependent oxidoreductase [Pseudoflavonifractor capillosus]|uniref:FAD-dependent oxidoreductase n=1 Tax=Pseudoflavonifractor capillosus TaxID=106588 RepID=UPI0023F8455D|nr:FAD-dependent oxidoreductase [Pseudoflavonifractor capillosus]MCI5928343.1 FAD-dependent oxidoreductase [Pseudoflavonifractor capillosus]MDY4661376.1 FAD-dependent oxidoreductase [Pseudoflavonifractor capillosus]